MAYIEFRDLGVEYSGAERSFTCFAAARSGRLSAFWENVRAAAFRAGTDIYITYYAKELARFMDQGRLG